MVSDKKYSFILYQGSQKSGEYILNTTDMDKIRYLAYGTYEERYFGKSGHIEIIEKEKGKRRLRAKIEVVINKKPTRDNQYMRYYWVSSKGKREINRNGTLRR